MGDFDSMEPIDDDNDGWTDDDEIDCQTERLFSIPLGSTEFAIGSDDDDDGVEDFQRRTSENGSDADEDGVGDNSDFPWTIRSGLTPTIGLGTIPMASDPTEWLDSDGDGVDNTDEFPEDGVNG